MIKKILVALDPDTDTPVATRYAQQIAQRYDAAVTGLAVVDMGSIEASSRGGGIGSMYLMEKVQKELTEEARQRARDLTKQFDEAMANSGVTYHVEVAEGAPFERIVEDMKYQDLLIVGRDPHFFYSHPETSTKTLVRVVRDTIAPTLVVPDTYRAIERVLITYDGSTASARAMRRFAHLQPFGTDVQVEILNVHSGKESEGSRLALEMAKGYLNVHGYEPHATSLQGSNAAKEIFDFAEHFEADLLVAGAHSVSMWRKLAFGSTTASLLEKCELPLFLDN
ncbi:MAG TPA: universal stress protein [Rhodothermales bacterium]|nr:universal stress protein [Rhodothermales bacterium]